MGEALVAETNFCGPYIATKQMTVYGKIELNALAIHLRIKCWYNVSVSRLVFCDLAILGLKLNE